MKTEEGEAKAKEFDILFTEVSAKAGHNVANLFKTLAVHLAGNEPGVTNIAAGGTTGGAAQEASNSLFF